MKAVDTVVDKEVRHKDAMKKLKTKSYLDKKRRAQTSNIKVEDCVVVKQDKETNRPP